MPLTAKGEKIKKSMEKTYGSRAEEVLYRSRNAGTISGIDKPITSRETFIARGGTSPRQDINTNSFVPGGRRR